MDPAPGIRVLVVDDDFAVAEVHRAYVEGIAGFSVVAVAHTGAQALHATHELPPGLGAARHPPARHLGPGGHSPPAIAT